ncbi:MAG: hypothetical protein AB7S26_31820 [Sandaracinaceae bacterium]
MTRSAIAFAVLYLASCGEGGSPATHAPTAQTEEPPPSDEPRVAAPDDAPPSASVTRHETTPNGRPTPWAPIEGHTRDVEGQILYPDDRPASGAEVSLVYLGDPHADEGIAYETTADAQGRFRFDRVSEYGGFDLVVQHDRAHRAAHLPAADATTPWIVRVAPSHDVPIEIRCTAQPGRSRSVLGTQSVEASVRWAADGTQVAWTPLPALDGTPDVLSGRGEPGMSRFRPGFAFSIPPVPANAHRFLTTLPLPEGTHRVTLTGVCGITTFDVVSPVPDPAPPPPVLPSRDASELVLELGADSARDYVEPDVALGGEVIASEQLFHDRPFRLRSIPAGSYVVSGVTCHDPIEVPSRSVVRVSIGPDRCDVSTRSQ